MSELHLGISFGQAKCRNKLANPKLRRGLTFHGEGTDIRSLLSKGPAGLGEMSFGDLAVFDVLDSSLPVATAAAPVFYRRVDGCAQVKQSCQRQS